MLGRSHEITVINERRLEAPGHVIIGAMPFASCFGPAYETAFVIDADLRKRKMRDKVPMTYVTSEPYIGHRGLGGVGDSKSVLESELRQHHINWICNAKVTKCEAGKMYIDEFQRNPKWQNIYSAGVCVAIPPIEVTPETRATWNALCLADMGDTGAAFVALPQMPPRNVAWIKKGKWVHLAKIACEKYILKLLGIGKLKE
ncbi:hypothetical protein [Congregibacter sp.]|uniref:hypothetical protein n=1 Tax=Congregibacter sp. TaxID=2744308 RepID=UPI003F6C2101